MREICVCFALLLLISSVTAKGYGHSGYHRKYHGNIYGHNIVRTLPIQQQFHFGGHRRFSNPGHNQLRNGFIAHLHHGPTTTIPYQSSGVVANSVGAPVVTGGVTNAVGTSGVLVQQPSHTVSSIGSVPSHVLGVTHAGVSPGMTFISSGPQSVPIQSSGSIPIGTQSVSFQSPGGIPVSSQGGPIQSTSSIPIGTQSVSFPAPSGIPVSSPSSFPIGLQSTTIQATNGGVVPVGAQPTFGGVQPPVAGTIQNNVGFQDVGFNLPVTPNAGFDSVPQAYVHEQGGLQTGVPSLGSPLNGAEKVGIPVFGGWASSSINDVVIREDNVFPVNIQQDKSMASILRSFHMK